MISFWVIRLSRLLELLLSNRAIVYILPSFPKYSAMLKIIIYNITEFVFYFMSIIYQKQLRSGK